MENSIGTHAGAATHAERTRFKVLGAISFSHFLNDRIQSLIVAIYPLLKGEFTLSFMQIGAITLTYQICASVLQPVIGIYTDKHPKPYSLSIGMCFTLIGIVALAFAASYGVVLVSAALLGALLAIAVLAWVGAWYKSHHIDRPKAQQAAAASPVSRARVRGSIAVLVL